MLPKLVTRDILLTAVLCTTFCAGEFRGGRLWGKGLLSYSDGSPGTEGYFQDVRFSRECSAVDDIKKARKVAAMARSFCETMEMWRNKSYPTPDYFPPHFYGSFFSITRTIELYLSKEVWGCLFHSDVEIFPGKLPISVLKIWPHIPCWQPRCFV